MAVTTLPPRTLIVTADDLGLHPDIDRGIEMAHRDGRFVEAHPALVARALSLRIRGDAVRRELSAQIERVRAAGIQPSHLDGHQHVHLLPRVWPVVVELARAHGIGWVRVPAFEPLTGGRPGPITLALRAGLNIQGGIRRAALGALRSADSTPVLGESGHLTVQGIVRGLRAGPGGAVVELVTHPGITTPELRARYDWGYEWSGETAALTDPTLREEIGRAGFELRRFADLAA